MNITFTIEDEGHDTHAHSDIFIFIRKYSKNKPKFKYTLIRENSKDAEKDAREHYHFERCSEHDNDYVFDDPGHCQYCDTEHLTPIVGEYYCCWNCDISGKAYVPYAKKSNIIHKYLI
jgi:hypothetical protein